MGEIDPTDEMVAAFERFMVDVTPATGDTRDGLAAVLAIVERDYYVGKRIPLVCGVAGPDDLTCQRSPEHFTVHASEAATGLVIW